MTGASVGLPLENGNLLVCYADVRSMLMTSSVRRPPISIDRRDPFASASALHFDRVISKYGAPVIVLNLVKKKERRQVTTLNPQVILPTHQNEHVIEPFCHFGDGA